MFNEIKRILNNAFKYNDILQPEQRQIVQEDINILNDQEKAIKKIEYKLIEDIDRILQEKKQKILPYKKNYIKEILEQIEKTIKAEKTELMKSSNFIWNKDIDRDLISTVCKYAIVCLEKIDQDFIENQNPINNLEKSKNSYFEIFKVIFNKQNFSSSIVSLLLESIKNGILEHISNSLPDKIFNKMLNITHTKILNDKQSLIANLLISLAEKGNLNSYTTYIKDPEQSIKDSISSYFNDFNRDGYVQSIIEETVKELLDRAKNFVYLTNKDIEKEAKDSYSITNWIKKFKELAKEELIISFANVETFIRQAKVSNYSCDDNFDFRYVQDELTKKLDNTRSEITSQLDKVFKSGDLNSLEKEMSKLRTIVVNKIIKLRIGCLHSCPLCGEICISGMDGHDGSHETPYHRPQGVNGYPWVKDSDPKIANRLVTENCQQLVASDSRFRNSATNNEWKPYKEYQQVNDYYASWKINGDSTLESGSYWKWFMATYSSQLAKLYKAEEPDIPESWKSFTKENEIEKLQKLIEG